MPEEPITLHIQESGMLEYLDSQDRRIAEQAEHIDALFAELRKVSRARDVAERRAAMLFWLLLIGGAGLALWWSR